MRDVKQLGAAAAPVAWLLVHNGQDPLRRWLDCLTWDTWRKSQTDIIYLAWSQMSGGVALFPFLEYRCLSWGTLFYKQGDG